eukprot:IDg12797t1
MDPESRGSLELLVAWQSWIAPGAEAGLRQCPRGFGVALGST